MKIFIFPILFLLSCNRPLYSDKATKYEMANIDGLQWRRGFTIIQDSLKFNPKDPYWQCEFKYVILQDTLQK